MAELIEKQAQAKSKKTFYLLILVFVLPFTAAVLLHLFDIKPGGKSYGVLVQPPKPLTIPQLYTAQGKAFSAQQWQKKWTIVMVDTDDCAAPCQAQVHLLKQVHTTLNKDIKRVQRVLLVPSHQKAETFSALQTQYPDLIILGGADTDTANFASQFSANGKISGNVYLVDPQGNLMMSYPSDMNSGDMNSGDMNPKGMQVDLKKLLKNSWAG